MWAIQSQLLRRYGSVQNARRRRGESGLRSSRRMKKKLSENTEHSDVVGALDFPAPDLSPFTKISWKGEELRVMWQPRIARISKLHSNTEYEMVKQGHRDCATLHIDWTNFEDLITKIMDDGLVWLPIVRSKRYGGFSHKHLYTHRGDPESFVYGVLARDLETAKTFVKASQNPTDHILLGDLLGYPRCCSEFFTIVWGIGEFDPLWSISASTEGQIESECGQTPRTISVSCHPFANQFLRYFGLRITTHFPCSLKCKETLKVGKIWFEVMRELDATAAEWLMEILKLPLEWSALKGIAKVDTPLFVGTCNTVFTSDERKVILKGVV